MVKIHNYVAIEYCNRIRGKLPAEPEWTYAAKGGEKVKFEIID